MDFDIFVLFILTAFLLFQSYERMNIADALFTRTFHDEDVIIQQVCTQSV